ncbi:DUF2004 domain-containing protein [Aureispira anguillae]|uniref:DUF2004 domain-containing protein n=1 Tax=Aureispira anguillae TaxID=2864201 RepID=A0A915YDR5_9BACT|nr:DUF2004 domain-containing protein [Aureispira anguillae]BDS11234.1 DUF2004 domain-containing protein [Aureispira anguillae]
MAIVEIPYLDEKLDSENLKEVYDGVLEIDGKKVSLDLWFQDSMCSIEELNKSINYLNNFKNVYQNAVHAIQDSFENKGEVRTLIEDHIEQFEAADKKILGIDEAMTPNDQIHHTYKKIHLSRIGLYPQTEEQFAILDFTISKAVTQYVFVVRTNSLGKVMEEVYVES